MENLVITFLGTNDYEKVNYYLDNPENAYFTPFPLVAYLKLNAFNLEKLRVKVFVTEEAEKKNLNYLKCELEKIGVNTSQIEKVTIKKGSNENEIRENFETLAESLEKGFEKAEESVIIDFTFSLRSIPILGMIAVLYARALSKRKDSSFPKIEMIYGAYEIGGKKEGRAPIFDLSSYFGLLELSLAVDEFINYGTAERFGELAENLEESPEKELAKRLQKLLEYVYVLRCPKIKNFSLRNINWKELEEKAESRELFTPELLREITDEVKVFKEKSSEWERILWAVEWCVKHNLYPQAYTILREVILNYACSLLVSQKPYEEDHRIRKDVESLLSRVARPQKRECAKDLLKQDKKAGNLSDEKLEKLVDAARLLYGKNSVSWFRNDIDHCAFGKKKERRKEPEELKKELSRFLEEVKKLLL